MPSEIPTLELLPSEKHLRKKVAVFRNVNFAVNGIALFHSKNASAMQNLGFRFGLGKQLSFKFIC